MPENSKTKKKQGEIVHYSRWITTFVIVIVVAAAGVGLQWRFQIFSSIRFFFQLPSRVIQLTSDLQQAQQTIHDLQQSMVLPQKTISLTKAASLINLANLHFSTGGNAQTALSMLQEAQKLVASSSDASNMQNAIQQDIDALKRYQQQAIGPLLGKLNQLSDLINQLPLLQSDEQLTTTEPGAKKDKLPFWKEGWQNSLSTIKSLVIIRHREVSIHPLITIQQQTLLKLYLQSLIGQASWSLLHHDPVLYKTTMSQFMVTLDQYYLQTNPDKKKIDALMNDLMKAAVQGES